MVLIPWYLVLKGTLTGDFHSILLLFLSASYV